MFHYDIPINGASQIMFNGQPQTLCALTERHCFTRHHTPANIMWANTAVAPGVVNPNQSWQTLTIETGVTSVAAHPACACPHNINPGSLLPMATCHGVLYLRCA